MINIASAFAGVFYAMKLSERCVIASQLIQMADMMAVELSLSVDHSRKIIKKLCREGSLSRLHFLNSIDLENINIKTGLRAGDDEMEMILV